MIDSKAFLLFVIFGFIVAIIWLINKLPSNDNNPPVKNSKVCKGPDPAKYDIVGNKFEAGKSIYPCQALQTKDKKYLFAVQDDGVAVLYKDGVQQIWTGVPSRRIILIKDNLILAELNDGTFHVAIDTKDTMNLLYQSGIVEKNKSSGGFRPIM